MVRILSGKKIALSVGAGALAGAIALIGYDRGRQFIDLVNPTTRNWNYYSFYPSMVFEANKTRELELENIKRAIEQRQPDDIEFFKSVDLDITGPFKEVVPEVPVSNMRRIIYDPTLLFTIWKEKIYYNRARPFQSDDSVVKTAVLDSKSASNPSYPSGHAVQAYVLAGELSKLYPDRREYLDRVADRIAFSRVQGGVHYPSDIRYGYEVAKIYVNGNTRE